MEAIFIAMTAVQYDELQKNKWSLSGNLEVCLDRVITRALAQAASIDSYRPSKRAYVLFAGVSEDWLEKQETNSSEDGSIQQIIVPAWSVDEFNAEVLANWTVVAKFSEGKAERVTVNSHE